MQEQTTKNQGWLGGLKVPFNFNALILCFAAVVIFKFGVFLIEEVFTSEGYIFERVVQKLDDSLDRREHPYLKWALGMVSPLDERQAAAIRFFARSEAAEARKADEKALRELGEKLQAEEVGSDAYKAIENQIGALKSKVRPPDMQALMQQYEAAGIIHSLPREALDEFRSASIGKHVWIMIALLGIVLWSFLAAAVCRISAMHLARDQGLELKEALDFARKKGHKILLCLAIPAALIVVLWGLNSLFGLLMNVMILDVLLAVLFVLIFLSSFFIVFVLFLSLFGFNLMGSAVATESSDVFDGISRAWDYLTSCPWHAILYYLAVGAYIVIFSLGVQIFVDLSLHTLSNSLYGLGSDDTTDYEITVDGLPTKVTKPAAMEVFRGIVLGKSADPFQRVGWVDGEWVYYYQGKEVSQAIGGTTVASAYVLWFWVLIAKILALAYVVHYWLSANTTIYFLLRREVDEDDFDQIYLEDEDELASLEDDASFAKVLDEDLGKAAADKPVIPDTRKMEAVQPEAADEAGAAGADEEEEDAEEEDEGEADTEDEVEDEEEEDDDEYEEDDAPAAETKPAESTPAAPETKPDAGSESKGQGKKRKKGKRGKNR